MAYPKLYQSYAINMDKPKTNKKKKLSTKKINKKPRNKKIL